MREIIKIENFNLGIINSTDGGDIPIEACSFSENVDGDVAEGILTGAPSETVFNSDSNLHTSAFILRSDGKHDLISYNAEERRIEHCSDFYGAHIVTVQRGGLAISDTAAITIRNREARTGVKGSSPVWTGYVDSRHFQDEEADTGLYTFDSELSSLNSLLPGGFYLTVDNAYIPNIFNHRPGSVLRYAFSLVYDGFQESPLSGKYDLNYEDIGPDILPYGVPSIAVTFNGTALSNKRVTALRVYRAVKNPDQDYFGEYRMLRDIALDASAVFNADDPYEWDDGWKIINGNQVYTFHDDQRLKASYTENTGMPEGLKTTTVGYALACRAEDLLIAGDCMHEEITDASHCLFISKEGRFDMFDWTNDILRLPFIPKAIAYFGGRIYAFDNSRYIKINPNGFYIEDEFEGAGCSNARGVIVTEWGMFFSNRENIWLHDGRQPIPVGDIIRRSNIAQDWAGDALSGNIHAVYNSQKGYALFLISSSGITKAWAYSPSKKRWDYFKVSGTMTGAFSGRDGETFISTSVNLLKMFSGATGLWQWTSGEISAGEPSQFKKFYKIMPEYTGSITVQYSRDNGLTWITDLEIPPGERKIKSIRLRITGEGGAIVRSVSILIRRLIGAR